MPRLSLTLALLFFLTALPAQEGRLPALDFIRDHPDAFGVEAADVRQLRETDHYASPDGTDHVYVAQLLYGTPVFNAQAAVHLRGERVVYHTSRLQADLLGRSVATAPAITDQQAFRVALAGGRGRLEASDLTYYPTSETGPLRLAWQLTFEDATDGLHYLSLIDAGTSAELLRETLSLQCHPATVDGAAGAGATIFETSAAATAPVFTDGAAYFVYPFGLESPRDGPRTLVVDPADPEASPYGWHDTNGEPGPEFTYTRGNNAYAYRDADTIPNQPDPGFRPDGGPELDFDFPFTPEASPDSIVPASIVQLFYSTNALHDWTYHHGFTPAAGNFQHNTYGEGGKGGDPVLAEAQNAATPNNATFFAPADGGSGRMQLSLWSTTSYLVEITGPDDLAGRLPSSGATFGAILDATGVTAELALGRDGSANPTLGCGPLTDPASLAGKIVLLDRGSCTFQEKAYYAEQAGAVGVIICNPENDLITMAGSDDGDFPVTIPVVMLRESDCSPLRSRVGNGGTVTVTLADRGDPPLDGAFDNGVVAHEYAHGVSIRLVGGPGANTCLLNDEQMGEGWSDFFLLASTPLTAGEQPTGREARGVGLYSTSAGDGEGGFRSQFYSTDSTINNLTYDRIITAAIPHGVGEIWAATLWDVYWRLVDVYGFDKDLIHGTGGNNAAVRLVIEGMKYTPCDPGFLDARDALLIADQLTNDGANQCLLWDVFRRRGLGASATQGEQDLSNDNREAFDLSPTCIPTVKVSKEVDNLYTDAGDTVTFTIRLRNDTDSTATGLVVTDELPLGLDLLPATVRGGAEVSITADRIVFDLPNLEAGESATVRYSARTDPARYPENLFFSGAEADDPTQWDVRALEGNRTWERVDSNAFSGSAAWFVPKVATDQDQVLQTREPIELTGPAPALRFFTRYETEPGFDAGLLEVSTDGETWEGVADRFLRFGYRGPIDSRGKPTLRGRATFWGNSDGYREAIVDLSTYRGQSVYLRFRFVSDAEGEGEGWYVDNIELLPVLTAYDGLVRLASTSGSRDSSSVAGPGVVINASAGGTVAVAAALPANHSVRVFPNPASTQLNVALSTDGPEALRIDLFAADGRRVTGWERAVTGGTRRLTLPLDGLPGGAYALRIAESGRLTTVTVVVEN
ncbi:M36 family metallopeptidase [Lewinella sp. IMCC34183]|uniref:M36 family metallopeptidase n=1 Tax=Lewinella sp. IMCC34183 TaxID=2248762 RepID=UPI000E23E249|nr:M36 family metallopeptidase [Lewinella sp. IMCC34183]